MWIFRSEKNWTDKRTVKTQVQNGTVSDRGHAERVWSWMTSDLQIASDESDSGSHTVQLRIYSNETGTVDMKGRKAVVYLHQFDSRVSQSRKSASFSYKWIPVTSFFAVKTSIYWRGQLKRQNAHRTMRGKKAKSQSSLVLNIFEQNLNWSSIHQWKIILVKFLFSKKWIRISKKKWGKWDLWIRVGVFFERKMLYSQSRFFRLHFESKKYNG